jgi:hypothetical protein
MFRNICVVSRVGPLQVWMPTIANQFTQKLQTDAPMNQTLCQFLGDRTEIVVDVCANIHIQILFLFSRFVYIQI